MVILDACNGTEHRRDEWISDEWNLNFAVFDADEATCVERASDKGDGVILDVIRRMEMSWEPLPEDAVIFPHVDPTDLLTPEDEE